MAICRGWPELDAKLTLHWNLENNGFMLTNFGNKLNGRPVSEAVSLRE